jgi:hypothetical protein
MTRTVTAVILCSFISAVIVYLFCKPQNTVSNETSLFNIALPGNKFAVNPGTAAYVGIPKYTNGPRKAGSALPVVMPTLVDHPYLFTAVLDEDVKLSLLMRLEAKYISDEKGKDILLVGAERDADLPFLDSYHTSRREIEVEEGDLVNLKQTFEDDGPIAWRESSNKEMVWGIVEMGKIGDKALDVLVILAKNSKAISDVMQLPDSAVYSEVKFSKMGNVGSR